MFDIKKGQSRLIFTFSLCNYETKISIDSIGTKFHVDHDKTGSQGGGKCSPTQSKRITPRHRRLPSSQTSKESNAGETKKC